jgi:hypothetical protein
VGACSVTPVPGFTKNIVSLTSIVFPNETYFKSNILFQCRSRDQSVEVKPAPCKLPECSVLRGHIWWIAEVLLSGLVEVLFPIRLDWYLEFAGGNLPSSHGELCRLKLKACELCSVTPAPGFYNINCKFICLSACKAKNYFVFLTIYFDAGAGTSLRR